MPFFFSGIHKDSNVNYAIGFNFPLFPPISRFACACQQNVQTEPFCEALISSTSSPAQHTLYFEPFLPFNSETLFQQKQKMSSSQNSVCDAA